MGYVVDFVMGRPIAEGGPAVGIVIAPEPPRSGRRRKFLQSGLP